MLQAALASGYTFVSYEAIADAKPPACILRHDVDYTPEWAEGFGRIEAELGISAYYFFQVCARPYNLREQSVVATVRALVGLGHRVGLHFDMSWDPNVRFEDLGRQCAEEKALFRAATGVEPCEVVTIHNPHEFKERVLNQPIPGIRHGYEKPWFSDIKYLSDSQGWYEGCACKVFAERRYERIQLLTHPYLWPPDADDDLIANISRMVEWKREQLLRYLVEFHPRCREHEARLRHLLD